MPNVIGPNFSGRCRTKYHAVEQASLEIPEQARPLSAPASDTQGPATRRAKKRRFPEKHGETDIR